MPPQHGAWAFLGLPIVAALPLTPTTPLLILLAGAWVAAYPASYFLLALIRDSRGRHPQPDRYLRPLALWSAAVLLLGLPLLLGRPWLIWVVFLYLVAFTINGIFARRRNERALTNDLVFVLECTAMVPVTWLVGAGATGWALPALADIPSEVWVTAVAVAAALLGSTLHVKSLIRERTDVRYARASRLFAAASLIVSPALAVWWGLPSGLVFVLPFAWFALRSWRWADPTMRPARIGMIELVGFVLVAAAVLLASVLVPSGPA